MKKIVAALIILSPWTFLIAGGSYQTKLDYVINKLKSSTTDSLNSEWFYFMMTDSVFPDWMGTEWDFNGISNTPGRGKIACGYFVSTTLKHIGFNLNRYKLAQEGASTVVDILCGKNKKQSVLESDIIKKLTELGNNRLYVVGLDYHIGFLAVENGQVYFIHSDYFKGKVVREIATDSASFSDTNAYVYGELTNNQFLFTKWKNGVKIF